MDQDERRIWLIDKLLEVGDNCQVNRMPETVLRQRELLRGLMNVRPPKPLTHKFVEIQDAYLQERLRERGVVDTASIKTIDGNICLWQGDITLLNADVIVNAANSQMLGCFIPNHWCIDNCIHTFAGCQLRLDCARKMNDIGRVDMTADCLITRAYNLPCKYIFHTVGPIVYGNLTEQNCRSLASCYERCLDEAEMLHVKSIAFPCISTGEYGFPNDVAGNIAVRTVKRYLEHSNRFEKVIFNVFKDKDLKIYKDLLNN